MQHYSGRRPTVAVGERKVKKLCVVVAVRVQVANCLESAERFANGTLTLPATNIRNSQLPRDFSISTLVQIRR